MYQLNQWSGAYPKLASGIVLYRIYYLHCLSAHVILSDIGTQFSVHVVLRLKSFFIAYYTTTK